MRNFIIATAPLLLAAAGAADNACGRISALWAEKANVVPKVPVRVPAATAYECLNTVPLDKEAAIALVDSIQPYLEWQSDAAYKADPPASYPFAGYDMFANLAEIKVKLQTDKYAREYAFQTDLFESVFAPGHDSHFLFYPDLLSKAFQWSRDDVLVSISEDGKSLPVIKLYKDVKADPKTAPAITRINDMDAATFIEEVATKSTWYSDIDAAYNSMFLQRSANVLTGSSGFFKGNGYGALLYPGPSTSFKFSNGTTLTVENTARVLGNWGGITDGASVYSRFCAPAPEPPALKHPYIPPIGPLPGAKDGAIITYPKPIISSSDAVVSGYYLTEDGLQDTACRDFFQKAVSDGRNKLLIDVQSNLGGIIWLVVDLFRQLFPDIQEDFFFRNKVSDGSYAIARAISDQIKDIDPLNTHNDNNQPFNKFEDKFSGRNVFKNTEYTALYRWDPNNPLITKNETYGVGIEISGYGSLAHQAQPFKPENIAIVHDGTCNSGCAFLSESLTIYGGVKSIVFGGRPTPGPMRGAGGARGGPIVSYNKVYEYAQLAKESTTDPKLVAALNRYTDVAFRRSLGTSVNTADWILRDHVNDGVPTQYNSHNSDCRLWWTAPMLTDIKEVWKVAANSAFNGAQCVNGEIKKGAVPQNIPPGPCQKIKKLEFGITLSDDFWSGTYDHIGAVLEGPAGQATLDIADKPERGFQAWTPVDLQSSFGSDTIDINGISTIKLTAKGIFWTLEPERNDKFEVQDIKLRAQCAESDLNIKNDKLANLNSWYSHPGGWFLSPFLTKNVATFNVTVQDWAKT
ncbi:pyridine nucleotide-disulfide oxidoreductase family protein [Hirsutella rhossiliensis]|uniref:Pyridine nucleotide-disulfide oxidoreductase family protein n=1 Tax=Hirsutella rhossiliensis TaxID=111463 RepID=A0A9P8N132_9HYPO|nr:pyridine nucleotide-disulfide oxidoreductase family protein [Hirsutella rhossiliensis]KAH0964004.1 pyridine nucleotide-disulfide oxidoreductase family protein [Hirsutella rhossiliensis]